MNRILDQKINTYLIQIIGQYLLPNKTINIELFEQLIHFI